MTNEERRQFQRINVNFIVTFQVDKPPQVRMSIGGLEVDALMVDLSEGGMALSTDYEIPAGTLLYVYFTLINPLRTEDDRVTKMELLGEVRSCTASDNQKQHRVGILFTKTKESDRRAIADFIRNDIKEKNN
jgi:c-di-GMP-binding flagellar brake protein YcgR